MSRFTGPQQAGALRAYRARKHAEATGRNQVTPVEARRWYRQAMTLPEGTEAQIRAAEGSDRKVARRFRVSPLVVTAIRQATVREDK